MSPFRELLTEIDRRLDLPQPTRGRILLEIAGDPARARAELPQRLNTILFWGIIAAVTGLLGQYSGMYNGLNAIAQAA